MTIARPAELTYDILQKLANMLIGTSLCFSSSFCWNNVSDLHEWIKKGKKSKYGEHFEFYKHIKKYNAYGILKIRQRLNDAAETGNCQICMWIWRDGFQMIIV